MLTSVVSPQPVAALPVELRDKLLPTLRVELRTTLTADPQLVGVQRYRAVFACEYYVSSLRPLSRRGAASHPDDIQNRPVSAEDQLMIDWAATHGVAPAGSKLEFRCGWAGMVTADMRVEGVAGQVDMISYDYGLLAGVLALGDWDEEVEPAWNSVEAAGELALLIGEVEIGQPFRGHDLGLEAVLLLLQHFSNSCAAAMLYPGDYTATVGDAKQAAHLRLTDHWSRIGFYPYAKGAMLLDMADDRRDLPEPWINRDQ